MFLQSESYQEDIYPMTAGNKPALTADEWLSGIDKGLGCVCVRVCVWEWVNVFACVLNYSKLNHNCGSNILEKKKNYSQLLVVLVRS